MKKSIAVTAAIRAEEGLLFLSYRYPFDMNPVSPKSGWTFTQPKIPEPSRMTLANKLFSMGIV